MSFSNALFGVLASVSLFSSPARADLPVHCVRHQVAGEWSFTLGPETEERQTCGHRRPDGPHTQPQRSIMDGLKLTSFMVSLQNPNRAVTADDKHGTWTMIYDEGFEVNANGLSFIAFSNFTFDAKQHNHSHCEETMVGWYRNKQSTSFGCFFGSQRMRAPEPVAAPERLKPKVSLTSAYDKPLTAHMQTKAVRRLNAKLGLLQVPWEAKEMTKWTGQTLRQVTSTLASSGLPAVTCTGKCSSRNPGRP